MKNGTINPDAPAEQLFIPAWWKGEDGRQPPLYTAAQVAALTAATGVQSNTKTHALLSTMIGLFLRAKEKIGYQPGSAIDKTVAEAVEHLKDWPYPETAPPAQPAAPQGVAYAELPARRRAFLCTKCGGRECEPGTLLQTHPPCKCGYLGFAEDLDFTADDMRDFADRTHALRASNGQAPAGATLANLRKALQFYADGHHFVMHDETAWDTVSGEPVNFYEDEAGTATVENGSIAKLALAGHPIKFEDEDAKATATAQATPAAPFNTETQDQIAAVMLQYGTEDQQRAALAYASAAPAAPHPIAPDVAADLERSDWTPEEALRWYAAGKHYDTVPNGDGTSSARILDNGAVASNALKSLSRDYAEHKGDVALMEGAAPAAGYDHGPQSVTVAEAARHVGKWLNERPNSPLDLRDVAMLCAHAQKAPAAGAVAEPWWKSEDIEVTLYPPMPTSGLQIGMPKGVKVMHKPTGLFATSEDERSQHRNRDVALGKLQELLAAAPTPAAQADSVLEDADQIRALIGQHAAILAQNESAYFELCYHRATGWMAWITDKPLCMPPVVNPDRKVLAHGQGDTAYEACRDAARKQGGA